MGLVCPEAEVSLDLRGSYVPESINGFLKEVSSISDASERLNMVDDLVRRLEEEMNKIHVFKRELPLSMLLLKDATVYLKQETTQCKTRNAHQPVLEEFIPLNSNNNKKKKVSIGSKTAEDEDFGRERDKKNWMSSVQLWSSPDSLSTNYNHSHAITKSTNTTNNNNKAPPITPSRSHNLFNCINHTHNELHSLKGNDKRNQIVGDDDDPCKIKKAESESVSKGYVDKIKEGVNVGGLSLAVPGMTSQEFLAMSSALGVGISGTSTSHCNSSSSGRPSSSSSARKQRRCWSPELHRRFVDALSHLGGPQVATPKQIRELMRVDGLTNDEVKSHLQKYRLHTRRVPNESGSSSNWTAQDQLSESSKPSSSQSASPEGPHQFPGITGGTSTTGGDSISLGDEDDEKSESYSWKGYVHTRPRKGADYEL